MTNAESTNRIAILALFAGIVGIVWLLIRKAKTPPILANINPMAPAMSVVEKLKNGYDASLTTFDDSEVKKYAGWLDVIVTAATKLKTSGQKVATEQMTYNAKVLKSMSDANLSAVVNYWQGNRAQKITQSDLFKPHYVDNTETIPALLRRLQDIGY